MSIEIIIKPLSEDEVRQAYELETRCYPADQAASLEAFRYRQSAFPDYFLSAWQGEGLIGLVCGVRTDAADCTDIGIKQRHGGRIDGSKLCILSVAVHPEYRAKGLGRRLLQNIVSAAKGNGLSAVMLMSQRELVPWYESGGFEATGIVHSEHGGVDWHDMVKRLNG
ncbi:GNAT family N-acetyltransferase [Cohnella sp. AR92]|uniref:GNAT family N-acetyltransferase n=1 Tax=Cohnella sp. AR92 TaxID=648716 RepID=UPI0013154C70|nr:GNAT family N-acetyltransferase [Cohnella sp. AR92]